MSHGPIGKRQRRCPKCIALISTRGDGRLMKHACGAGILPAPTPIGAELAGDGPFPEDVSRVADRDGIRLRRELFGWYTMPPDSKWVALQLGPGRGPYYVLEVS